MNVFSDPAQFFDLLRSEQQARARGPMLAILAGTAVVWWLYFQKVDMSWLVDRNLSAVSSLTPRQLEMARASVRPEAMAGAKTVAAVAGLAAWYLVMSVWFLVMGRLAGCRRSLRDWLGFQAWSSLPLALSLAVTLVSIVTMSPQTMPGAIALTHVDPLLVQLPAASPWKPLLARMDLIGLWCIGLAAVGWRSWVGASWGRAMAVAAAPAVAVFGVWAALIALAHGAA